MERQKAYRKKNSKKSIKADVLTFWIFNGDAVGLTLPILLTSLI